MNSSQWLSLLVKRLYSFLPLLVFSYYSKYAGCGAPTDAFWAHAFGIGGLTALFQIAYFYYKRIPFDYIAVASYLFLIGGALGFLGLTPLLLPYLFFRQATLLFFVVVVGVLANLLSKKGFLQLEGAASPTAVVYNSWLLVGCAVGLFMLSWWLVMGWKTGTFLGVVLPFIALLRLRGVLRERATQV